MGNVDLHIHSQVSDGTMTPDEIIERAIEQGVTTLAIADHDEIDSSLALKPLCEAHGIRYIPAVEHTALFDGHCVHILSYHADLMHSEFTALRKRARRALDGMSETMIERMAKQDARVSPEDFAAFERDPSLGGWKGLEYLMHRGVTASMQDGMRHYGHHGVSYVDADFPSLSETIAAIHAAGGIAVLAHPGDTIPTMTAGDPEPQVAFQRELDRLIAQGLDGVECYYPDHEPWVTQACLDKCNAEGLAITSGSDCHGTFQYTDIGQPHIDESMVRL